MRTLLRLLVSVIGIATLVFGIIFIFQSNSAKQQVADDIAPVTLEQLNAQYDAVSANQKAIMQAEEPNIRAGKAQPSAMYTYLTTQKTGLGLAKANVGNADLIVTMGIIDIIIGLGLAIGGGLSLARARV